MRFTKLVRNKNIPWPTQIKFSAERWKQDAEKCIEDATDENVYETGLWADLSLSYIRSQVIDLTLWKLPIKKLARKMFAFVNSDTKQIMSRLENVESNSELKPLSSFDEVTYQTLNEKLWGSQKASSILDTSIDSAELCLRFASGITKRGKVKDVVIDTDFVKALNYAAYYMAIEDAFYEVLWLDWSLKENDEYWELSPKDFEKEAILAAALKRHEELLYQTITSARELWHHNRLLARLGIPNSNSSSLYNVIGKDNKLFVHLVGKTTEDEPPRTFLFHSWVAQLYYSPLVNAQLDLLERLSISNLLDVFVELRSIAQIVFENLPLSKKGELNSDSFSDVYCPLLQRASVIRAISQSLELDEHKVSRLVDAITWSTEKSSVYFHPVISMNTPDGLYIFFVFHPILSINPYWLVDYWLSNFGLSMKWRGSLFEEQIFRQLTLAIQACEFKDLVKISNHVNLTATDGSSEEFDVILKINEIIIVGEAKCQKFPISVLERANYLKTLETASEQANRKVEWALRHYDVIANRLGINTVEIKGIFPIIITNHPVGVGLRINGVPVLDLLLLENYFASPYPATGIVDKDGIKEIRGKPFYSTPDEFSKNFYEYATYPHPINKMLEHLKPTMIFLPLGLTKALGRIEFIIDTDKI